MTSKTQYSVQDYHQGIIMVGMVTGIVYATFACLIWGVIFFIPNLLATFHPVEVVLGRYLAYGVFSIGMLLRKGWKVPMQFPPKAWLAALIFALLSNICYYFGVVWGLRYASAPLTVLIVGLSPVLIALYGNWHVREISYKHMILPCLWIAAGVVMVNVAEFKNLSHIGIFDLLLGLVGIVIALFGWSIYVVHNARFLKKNVHLPTKEWATVIGVATFALAGSILVVLLLFGVGIDLNHFAVFSPELAWFLLGITVLGVACSWGGCYLWNRASCYLPVSMLGPLMILETVFGLLYVYLVAFQLPSWSEALGIILLLSGLFFALHVFKTRKFKSL